jgi:hypothetical protein
MTGWQETDDVAAIRVSPCTAPSAGIQSSGYWAVLPGFFGAGTIVVGSLGEPGVPSPTLAVVPPGVWARNPDSEPEDLARDGWRVYRWASGRLIDQHRPLEISRVSMLQVYEFLRRQCPAQLTWFEDVVRSQLHHLESVARDGAAETEPIAAGARDAWRELERDFRAVFGGPSARLVSTDAVDTGPMFSRMGLTKFRRVH